MKRLLATALILFTAIASAEHVEQKVTNEKYNTFVFDKPYKKLVFEPNSPVSEPLPLDGNFGFLLHINKGAKLPFQLVVELINGETVEFQLIPHEMEVGHEYRRNGAGIYSEPEGQRARPSDKWVTDVLREAYQQKTPVGFMEEGQPAYAELGDTYLLPIKRFNNNLYEILIYEVRSETPKNIQPRDFWHEKVEAVQLEGDIVSPNHRPILFILREVAQDGR